MKVAFVHTGKAFLPEIPAYRNYLEINNHKTIELHSYDDVIQHPDLDLVFRFGGVVKAKHWQKIPEIHEYHSASTSNLPILKNIYKSMFNSRPSGRVFLNDFVKSQFYFNDAVPFIYRDMGAPSSLMNCSQSTTKDFDICYAGSITGRAGLLDIFFSLAEMGFKLGLAGNASLEEINRLKSHTQINYLGKLPGHEVRELFSRSRFGLNYCPDIYPFNSQTSTKVIEYLVAGLPIISNKYGWIESHKVKHGYSYIDINDILCPDSVDEMINPEAIISDRNIFTWDRILSDCCFLEFLQARVI